MRARASASLAAIPFFDCSLVTAGDSAAVIGSAEALMWKPYPLGPLGRVKASSTKVSRR